MAFSESRISHTLWLASKGAQVSPYTARACVSVSPTHAAAAFAGGASWSQPQHESQSCAPRGMRSVRRRGAELVDCPGSRSSPCRMPPPNPEADPSSEDAVANVR